MTSKKDNLFDLIFEISEHITTEKEGELSVITFPRFRNKFIQKYFVLRKSSAIIRVRLDEHGTAVWNLIDGKRSVATITELLSDHFHSEKKYEYRIADFVAQLYRQGFVKIQS